MGRMVLVCSFVGFGFFFEAEPTVVQAGLRLAV